MAMNGSFAGGLADGLRNGMAIGQAYDLAKDRKLARETEEKRKQVDKEIAAAMTNRDPQQQAASGLDRIQVPQSVPTGTMQGELAGLQPVPVAAPVAPASASAQSLGLAEVAARPPRFGAGMQQPGAAALPGTTAEKKSPDSADYLGGGEFGQIADGLTRAYRKALELGEPGRAMQLLADRERFVGQHREQAFTAAQSRYQLTGDPNSYVPFVNRFMPGGIEVQSINRRSEQGGGAPMYDFVGVDTATGKPIQQPISDFMLQSFVRSVSDPKAQQAMVAQQAKLLYEAEQKRRDKQLDSQLRSDEELRKPRVVGKDQTLFVPDGKGGMRVGAEGSEAGKPKMVTSDKDFASHVMRLFKVDSLEGLGEDERERVGGIIATGENINRLNAGTPAGKVLTAGNLAALSKQIRDGRATFEPLPLANGAVGFTVRHEGARVRVPVSVVPNQVQQMVAAQLERGAETSSASSRQPVAPAAGEPRRSPSKSAVSAPPAQSTATADVEPGAEDAEGAQLDAARAELRQAEATARQLRTKPPGLKAGQEARGKHAALLQQADRDVELARMAERAAAERWARATEGSDITRAAMGRINAE